MLDEEEGDDANDDVIITNVQAEQNNTRMTSNLKHQRNIQATHASSSMAAQAVAMGFPPESATAIGNFAAKTVVKSFTFAQAATGTRAGTSAPTNEPFPPLPRPGQTPGHRIAPDRQVNRKRPRLAQSFPYKTGTGNIKGLAASKPSWHANKSLVVAGIDK